MNLSEIKSELGYGQLNLNTAEDAQGVKTEWMRHWDNSNRVAVSIHKETIAAIKKDASTSLGLQTEIRTGAKGDYTAKRIVMYTPAELIM
jgi:hypothetical protein